MVKKSSKVEMIVFDLELNGKVYNNVVLDYPEEEDWCLTLEDLYSEDNDSWCMVELSDNLVVDFQMYGDDDSKGMKAELRMQGNVMVKSTEGDYYEHTKEWFGSYDTPFTNVRIVTSDGVKRIKL